MTNPSRRKLLALWLTAIAALGLVLAAIPFVKSLNPNPCVAAAAPAFDVKDMKPGQLDNFDFGIWVYRRTAADLAALGTYEEYLADPLSTKSQQSSALATQWRRSKVSVGKSVHSVRNLQELSSLFRIAPLVARPQSDTRHGIAPDGPLRSPRVSAGPPPH